MGGGVVQLLIGDGGSAWSEKRQAIAMVVLAQGRSAGKGVYA